MKQLNEVFQAQHGIITRDQARAGGLSDHQIDHRLRTGLWVRELPGTYRLGGVPPSWASALSAATLASKGVASHRCAAALWWLEPFREPRIEISVPHGRWARLDGVLTHQSTQWTSRAETVKRGISCTGVERTILDCGAVVSARTVERLAESAIRKRYCSWLSLLECLRAHSEHGRSGCLNLRRVLEDRLRDRTVPLSDFSRLVSNLLVDNGLPAPVLEHRIHDDDGEFVMQADLAWPDQRKAWELDGLRYHFGREEVERDRRKRNRAKACGWNIQEILWSMYTDEPDNLVEMARRFLLPPESRVEFPE